MVGGTISGESGIVAMSIPDAQNSKIAVWQIKANDNSKPVAYVPGDDGKIEDDETKALLGMIDYIIKYGDGQKGFFSALAAACARKATRR